MALAYTNGITQPELVDWLDVERKTIDNWLTRIEDRAFESAVPDDDRPGRPRTLNDEQLDGLESGFQNPPTVPGFDAFARTTELL